MPSSVMRWLRRGTVVAVLVAALAYLPWRIYGSDGFEQYRRLDGERHQLDRANGDLRLKNRALRREIDRLRHDLDTVGSVARDDLGLVRADEIVVVVEQPVAPVPQERAP